MPVGMIRDHLLQVKLSAYERALLRDLAAAEHQTVSETVRGMVRAASRRLRAGARPPRAEPQRAAP
jgi:hypothetical protein